MIFAALSAFVSKIPTKVIAWVFLVVALVAIGFFWGRSGPVKELAEYKATQNELKAKVGAKSAEATTKVVTEYVDRIVYRDKVGPTITKKVKVYVPRNVCSLPPEFRGLHDSAANGVPLPEGPLNTDGGPVDSQDFAETAVENYDIAHRNADKLKALQDWIREQEKAHAVKR